ncbi:hypothetical protein DVH05_000255 [Phytophthora capsici]|nr:hypothetical protein DVH05_000255 [Phytophthora capsici]
MTNDKFPSLDDALAFLGWCESGVGGNDVLTESIDEMLDGAVKSAAVMPLWKQEPSVKVSNHPSKKKPRSRNPAHSSTTLQRRKRATIQMLREQAVGLQGYLKQLKKRRGGPNRGFLLGGGDLSDGGLSPWYQRSLVEYQKRLRSEQTNKL